MVLDPQHLCIIKRQKHRKLLSIIPGVVVQAIAFLIISFLTHSPPKPMRTSSLSRAAYITEILNCKNPRRIQEVLRMKLEMFQFLCLELKSRGGLADSKCIVVEEQVIMFLFILAHAPSNHEVQERFQHSGETVSRHLHAVLQAINKLISH